MIIKNGFGEQKLATKIEIGVQNVHTVSGEDFVGRVFYDSEDDVYSIERPIVINVGFNPDTGRFSISPMPIRPYLRQIEELSLEGDHVMWVLPVTEQLEQLWLQTTSNIILPDASHLLNLTK